MPPPRAADARAATRSVLVTRTARHPDPGDDLPSRIPDIGAIHRTDDGLSVQSATTRDGRTSTTWRALSSIRSSRSQTESRGSVRSCSSASRSRSSWSASSRRRNRSSDVLGAGDLSCWHVRRPRGRDLRRDRHRGSVSTTRPVTWCARGRVGGSSFRSYCSVSLCARRLCYAELAHDSAGRDAYATVRPLARSSRGSSAGI